MASLNSVDSEQFPGRGNLEPKWPKQCLSAEDVMGHHQIALNATLAQTNLLNLSYPTRPVPSFRSLAKTIYENIAKPGDALCRGKFPRITAFINVQNLFSREKSSASELFFSPGNSIESILNFKITYYYRLKFTTKSVKSYQEFARQYRKTKTSCNTLFTDHKDYKS